MSIIRRKHVWLITWEGANLKLDESRKLAGIIGSRRSPKHVCELMEFLYELTISNAADLTTVANRPNARPFSAEKIQGGSRFHVGHNPFLYARVVADFRVTSEDDNALGTEILTWTEPDEYGLIDKSNRKIGIVRRGQHRSITRPISKMVLDCVPY
jgi:hypothetical protein